MATKPLNNNISLIHKDSSNQDLVSLLLSINKLLDRYTNHSHSITSILLATPGWILCLLCTPLPFVPANITSNKWQLLHLTTLLMEHPLMEPLFRRIMYILRYPANNSLHRALQWNKPTLNILINSPHTHTKWNLCMSINSQREMVKNNRTLSFNRTHSLTWIKKKNKEAIAGKTMRETFSNTSSRCLDGYSRIKCITCNTIKWCPSLMGCIQVWQCRALAWCLKVSRSRCLGKTNRILALIWAKKMTLRWMMKKTSLLLL